MNCAGITNEPLVYNDTSDGARTWRRAVNVNLVAVIDGTRIAVSLLLIIGKYLSSRSFSNSNSSFVLTVIAVVVWPLLFFRHVDIK
jgi:NAD(P)-dependent dehydrogenase (short-subunit alcohol dehydrogenase family)